MKKWEEEQRKKNHLKKVGQAKSTIGASAKRQGRTSSQFSGGALSTHNTTQILAISNGMPVAGGGGAASGSVTGSAYSKGPTGSLSSNSKLSRGFQTNPHGSAVRNKSPSSQEIAALKAQFGTPKVSANQAMIANRRRQYLDASGISRKELPNLPIYQLLRAFNLQQYAMKLAEKGYGSEVYKLALLTPRQREDLVSQLKVLPGHNAKLAAFFAVCDQMYPRQKVIEQIKAFTPTSRGGYKGNKQRVTSATGTRYDIQNASLLNQVGPQRTLMQKYDQLDKDTKKQFNQHFMASLETAMRGHTSISQFIQQSTGVDQANAKQAMNDIFPPQFYTYGADVVQGMNTEKVRNEVDSLVKRFTKGTSYALQQEEARLQRELATAKADIDLINMEVEQNLKRSAIVEKHSAKKQNLNSGQKSNERASGPFQRAKSNQEALRAQQLGQTQSFVPQGQLPQFIVGPQTAQSNHNQLYKGPFNSNKITNQTQQVGSGLKADLNKLPPSNSMVTTGVQPSYATQEQTNKHQNLAEYKKEVGIYGGSEAVVHDLLQDDGEDDGTRQISIDFCVGATQSGLNNNELQKSQQDQEYSQNVDELGREMAERQKLLVQQKQQVLGADNQNYYENLEQSENVSQQNSHQQTQQSQGLLMPNQPAYEIVEDDDSATNLDVTPLQEESVAKIDNEYPKEHGTPLILDDDDTDCDAMIEDSQNLDDDLAVGLLGDPKKLSEHLKNQYESIVNKNASLRAKQNRESDDESNSKETTAQQSSSQITKDTEDMNRQVRMHEAIASLARKQPPSVITSQSQSQSKPDQPDQSQDYQQEDLLKTEVIIDEKSVKQFGLVPADEEEIEDDYADDINDFVDSEDPESQQQPHQSTVKDQQVGATNNNRGQVQNRDILTTPNLDDVQAQIKLETQKERLARIQEGVTHQKEEEHSGEVQNNQNGEDEDSENIMWPSQQPAIVKSEEEKQAELLQARKEKELAMARKREIFNQKFPSTMIKPATQNQPPKEDGNNQENQQVRWTPLLEKEEKEQAWNLGHSLDSKKVTSALGYLDLKQICYCLAQALNKHIVFSQGFFFLGELQIFVKQTRINNSAIKGGSSAAIQSEQTPQHSRSLMPPPQSTTEDSKVGKEVEHDDCAVENDLPEGKDPELEFTYNLGDKFRIDIEGAKQRQKEESRKKRLAHDEATEESKKNFEELKRQMEESMGKGSSLNGAETPSKMAKHSEKLQSSLTSCQPPVRQQQHPNPHDNNISDAQKKADNKIGTKDEEESPTKMDDGIEDEIGDSYREDFDGGAAGAIEEEELINGNSTAAGQKMAKDYQQKAQVNVNNAQISNQRHQNENRILSQQTTHPDIQQDNDNDNDREVEEQFVTDEIIVDEREANEQQIGEQIDGQDEDFVGEEGLPGGDADSDLDLDYSQTHLEDFLKSQTQSSLMKGTNIQSGQLLNSFITTYNRMKGSGSGLGQTNANTLSQSKKNNKESSAQKDQQMNAIEEKSQDGQSQTNESKNKDDFESDDEEFLGRNQDEVIDLEHVSVKSSSPMKKHKAIISKEEAAQIRKDVAKNQTNDNQISGGGNPKIIPIDMEFDSNEPQQQQPSQFEQKEATQSARNTDLDSSDDEFYDDQQKQQAAASLGKDQQNIQLNMTTRAGAKEAIKFKMRVFDYRYDFKTDELASYEGEESLEQNLIAGMPGGPGGPQAEAPTLEELYYYCKYVIISGRMEKEIPILCLIYLERFFTKTGILMTGRNWKRLTLISLILASKIWDDDSLENVHFPQVMSDITIKEIAGIEAVFLQMIDFDLVIRGAEYAKYYFILKTFAEQFKSTLPMGPITVNEMSRLQNNTVKAESDLREKYNVKLALKKTM